MRIDNPLIFGSFTTSGSILFQASGSFTGSFTGDGTNLTGILPQGTVSSSAQLADAISGSINSLLIFMLVAASILQNPCLTRIRICSLGIVSLHRFPPCSHLFEFY